MNELVPILEFLKLHQQCVLATIGQDGRPQAAVLTYSVNDLAEIMFGTEGFTRKYQNLKRDSRVAVVVGFDTSSVQIEGVSRQISGTELESRKAEHFARLPEPEKAKEKPDMAYFNVSPTWMRLTNTATEPWEVHELRFDDERV